jgi:hypothetical protein
MDFQTIPYWVSEVRLPLWYWGGTGAIPETRELRTQGWVRVKTAWFPKKVSSQESGFQLGSQARSILEVSSLVKNADKILSAGLGQIKRLVCVAYQLEL